VCIRKPCERCGGERCLGRWAGGGVGYEKETGNNPVKARRPKKRITKRGRSEDPAGIEKKSQGVGEIKSWRVQGQHHAVVKENEKPA